MMDTFKIVIEYDGTAFNGWQVQPAGRTVQEEIQKALAVMTRREITIVGSGRTDSGVHALGQSAHFSCDTGISAEGLQKGLNSLLPDDIVIISCRGMKSGFHARYDVERKTYRYRILNRRLPAAVGRLYAWHIRKPLDLSAMASAAAAIAGRHDFKAFEAKGSPRSHTMRHVTRAEFKTETPDMIVFEIEADGFLRYMVRNIVGTLVEVGLGKRRAGQMRAILESRDRARAGVTAPPQGLFLVRVDYRGCRHDDS